MKLNRENINDFKEICKKLLDRFSSIRIFVVIQITDGGFCKLAM